MGWRTRGSRQVLMQTPMGAQWIPSLWLIEAGMIEGELENDNDDDELYDSSKVSEE